MACVPELCFPGKAPTMSSMPPSPIATRPIATMPSSTAAGAGESVPRFFDHPGVDEAVKKQIVWALKRFAIPQVAELVESNFQIRVSREQMLAVWNAQHAPKAPKAETPAAPDESRPDKESQHPADRQDCTLTLPPVFPESNVVPQPAAPTFSIATEPAPAEAAPPQ